MNMQTLLLTTKKYTDTNPRIHIVGPQQLQNELLAYYLKTEAGLPCTFGPNFDIAKSSTHLGHPCPSPWIVLWDCLGHRNEFVAEDIITRHFLSRKLPPEHYDVLINIKADKALEKRVIKLGIRGLFPARSPLALLPLAISAIQNGELWFTREILSQHVIEQKTFAPPIPVDENSKPILTQREKEILLQISAGTASKDIARNLCISSHTVKTHLHNVYKKISVTTRTQATLWARNNLF